MSDKIREAAVVVTTGIFKTLPERTDAFEDALSAAAGEAVRRVREACAATIRKHDAFETPIEYVASIHDELTEPTVPATCKCGRVLCGEEMNHGVCTRCRETPTQTGAAPTVFAVGRCEHQDAKGHSDCDSRAVLCEAHGGHDACAVELMNAQAEIARLRAVNERGHAIADAARRYVRTFFDAETQKALVALCSLVGDADRDHA